MSVFFEQIQIETFVSEDRAVGQRRVRLSVEESGGRMTMSRKKKKQSFKQEEEDGEVLLEKALPVEGGDEFDLDIPPTSGAEYLKRVHLEAQGCPDVVVADVDESKVRAQTVNVSSSNGCQPCPAGFSAPLRWQLAQIADFSEVRQRLVKHKLTRPAVSTEPLPDVNDAEAWCRLCFGRMMVQNSCDRTDPGTCRQSTPPYLSIISQLDQPGVEKLLDVHVQWFQAAGFSRNQGQWFYALLTSLEKPLTPETCASLRSLARQCCALRASLDSPDHPLLPQLNLIVCLVSRYFDQSDMSDV